MSESAGKTITVAAVLCGVCSVLVAGAVVVLRPRQLVNQDLDQKKNILLSAGLYESKEKIDATFNKFVEAVVIDVTTGEVQTDIDASKFNQDKADKDPQFVEDIPQAEDYATIRRRSRLQKVYLVKKDGSLDQIVFHVYGKGLWSTMKAFLSVDRDGVTIRGFNYYAHGETPGLGGEIENPGWVAQWKGKKIYDDSGDYRPKTRVVKGQVNPQDPNAPYSVDGLSGATLTSNGVEGTFRYWLSDSGYKSFLGKVREGVIQ